MQISGKLQIICAALVFLLAQARCEVFLCYVCENCEHVTETTPRKICDETFFENVETTRPPNPTSQSTIILTKTTTTSTSTSTVKPSTEETTITTESTAPTESTLPPMPTASTVGPPLSTTALPTPPTPGAVAGPTDVEVLKLNVTTTPIPPTAASTTSATEPETTFLKRVNLVMEPAQLRVRQLRSLENSLFTYHCYWTQQTVNGSPITSRGCSRINQTEAVCPQLEMISNTTFSKCTPCTNSLCNSSGTVGVSTVAVILGLVCAFLLGFPA